MPIDTSHPQPASDVHVDENGDAYRVCHRDDDDEKTGEIVVEWRFYFNGRSSQR